MKMAIMSEFSAKSEDETPELQAFHLPAMSRERVTTLPQA